MFDIVFQCGDHACQCDDVGSSGVSDIVFQCGDVYTNVMMLAAAVCLTLCFSVVTCIPMR